MKPIVAVLAPLLVAACVSSGTPHVTINGLSGRMIAMHDYYPVFLRDSGVPGLVSLNYSVSAAGVPVRIVVTKATKPAFARAAVYFLRDWHFQVPPNWTADGGPQRRFKARVKFLVTCVLPAEKLDPTDPEFTVSECHGR